MKIPFSELPYNLPHIQKNTNLRSSYHQPIMPSSYRLLGPQHFSASFLSFEINRKSSPRLLFISSTVLRSAVDSQGAATVRIFKVLLTSKASAKACSCAAEEVTRITADTKKTSCAIWHCLKLTELGFPASFSYLAQLEQQNDAKHTDHTVTCDGILKPIKSQTPGKNNLFPTIYLTLSGVRSVS